MNLDLIQNDYDITHSTNNKERLKYYLKNRNIFNLYGTCVINLKEANLAQKLVNTTLLFAFLWSVTDCIYNHLLMMHTDVEIEIAFYSHNRKLGKNSFQKQSIKCFLVVYAILQFKLFIITSKSTAKNLRLNKLNASEYLNFYLHCNTSILSCLL